MPKQFYRRIILVFFLVFLITNIVLADDCDDEHYDLFVNFLNLDQGDSVLIRTMEGKTVLIDTGYGNSLEKIDSALNNKDYNSHGKIDYLIGTLPPSENIGNMARLIETTKVGTIYLSKNIFPTQSGKEIIAISMNKGLKVNEIKDGTSINLNKDISIGFLSSNDDNTFIKLTYKKISFLFVRGLKEISDQDVIKLGSSLKSNFLNISSDNNLTICDAFLNAVSPPFTIISGKSKSFSYDSVLKRILESRNSNIYRTDRDGWISVDTDGNRLSNFTENLLYV